MAYSFFSFSKVLIIAEIGVNHNGNLELAKQLILEAKNCGADAVKFQTFKAEELVSPGTPKVGYQKSTTAIEETHFEMIKRLELSNSDHHILKAFCDEMDITFLSTPYDVESARFLIEDLDVQILKTASADLVDMPLQQYIASSGKPTIVSVGMASLGEVEAITSLYRRENNENFVLLHCVSNYPCSNSSVNLAVLETLRSAFKCPVGFSDHTVGNLASACSIMLGATVVEKHFTLDRDLPGPDHKASASPKDFQILVNSIRTAEAMLGSGVKVRQTEEEEMASIARKSIHVAQPLKKTK